MPDGAQREAWQEYRQGWQPVEGDVIAEELVTLYVNGHELATIMSTPQNQDWLALGFLKNEGLIESMDEVDHVHIVQAGCCIDVWLTHSIRTPQRRIITSGCGGGVTFNDPSLGIERLHDELRLDPEKLFDLFPRLHFPDSLHARARGVHASALSDGQRILALVEDVGRHNTLDKLVGVCLVKGIETRGRILLATGRISSEMLHKAARMGCPIVASRNSPTSLSITLAREWNITLVGYVRQRSMRVYAHPERLQPPQPAGALPAPAEARSTRS
ncbi:MAG: formate dehydrogenase accessory sulfurtransferase FdhD [Chloroflexota bacterium]